jgi:hypothetical protein
MRDNLPFPDEIVVEILRRLRVRDLLRAAAVCRQLRRIGRDSAPWGTRTVNVGRATADHLAALGRLVGRQLNMNLRILMDTDPAWIPQVDTIRLDCPTLHARRSLHVFEAVTRVDTLVQQQVQFPYASFPNVVDLWVKYTDQWTFYADLPTVATLPSLRNLQVDLSASLNVKTELPELTRRILHKLPRLVNLVVVARLGKRPAGTAWSWDSYMASWPQRLTTRVLLRAKVRWVDMQATAFESSDRTGSVYIADSPHTGPQSVLVVVVPRDE